MNCPDAIALSLQDYCHAITIRARISTIHTFVWNSRAKVAPNLPKNQLLYYFVVF